MSVNGGMTTKVHIGKISVKKKQLLIIELDIFMLYVLGARVVGKYIIWGKAASSGKKKELRDELYFHFGPYRSILGRMGSSETSNTPTILSIIGLNKEHHNALSAVLFLKKITRESCHHPNEPLA
jgi:hypothetical protein